MIFTEGPIYKGLGTSRRAEKGSRIDVAMEPVFVSNAGEKMVPLALRLDIVNHRPTGFAWGYSGSGGAQLAVALLADWMSCDHAARALHQRFKGAAIVGLPEKHWSLNRRRSREKFRDDVQGAAVAGPVSGLGGRTDCSNRGPICRASSGICDGGCHCSSRLLRNER